MNSAYRHLCSPVNHMKDYEAFTRRIFFDNPNIKNFITNVVIDQVKVGLTIPPAADE